MLCCYCVQRVRYLFDVFLASVEIKIVVYIGIGVSSVYVYYEDYFHKNGNVQSE